MFSARILPYLFKGMLGLFLLLNLFFAAVERPLAPQLSRWSPSQLEELEKKRDAAQGVVARAVALLTAEDAPAPWRELGLIPVAAADTDIPRPFSAVQGDTAAAFAWKGAGPASPAFSTHDGLAVIVPPVELYGGLIPRFYLSCYVELIASIGSDLPYQTYLTTGTGWEDPPAYLDVYVDKNFTRQTEAGGTPVAQGLGVVMLHDLPVFLVANLPAGENPEAARRTLRDRLQRFGRLLTELDAPSPTSVLGEAVLRSLTDPVLLLFAVVAGWIFAAEAGFAAFAGASVATLLTVGQVILRLAPPLFPLAFTNLAVAGGLAFLTASLRRLVARDKLAERLERDKAALRQKLLDKAVARNRGQGSSGRSLTEKNQDKRKLKKLGLLDDKERAALYRWLLPGMGLFLFLGVATIDKERQLFFGNQAVNNVEARLDMLGQKNRMPLSPAETARRLAGILECPMGADSRSGTLVFLMEKNQTWNQLPGKLDFFPRTMSFLLDARSETVDMNALADWSITAPPEFAPSALVPLPFVSAPILSDEDYATRWKQFWREQLIDVLGMDESEYWTRRLARSPADPEALRRLEELVQAGNHRAADALIESCGLAEAADLGSPKARTTLAQRNLDRWEKDTSSRDNFLPEPAAMIPQLQEAAVRDGDATAFGLLADFSFKGVVVPKSLEQALVYTLAKQILDPWSEEEEQLMLSRSKVVSFYAQHGMLEEDMTGRAYDKAMALTWPVRERRREAAARHLAGRAAVIRNMREQLPWMRWAFVSPDLRKAMGEAMRKKLEAEGESARGADAPSRSGRPLAWEKYLEAWREYGTELPLAN